MTTPNTISPTETTSSAGGDNVSFLNESGSLPLVLST